MNTCYVLFNPKAGDGDSELKAHEIAKKLDAQDFLYQDVTALTDMAAYFSKLTAEDCVLVCGGDGTMSRFADSIQNITVPCKIYAYATGIGNDFWRDIDHYPCTEPVDVTQYVQNLPLCYVNGEKHHILNGVGFGIDGYCCLVGDQLREKGKKPNYTTIAIKGLLTGYHAPNAEVTVDGKKHSFKRIWIAPTMKGRFYGGGMMPAPKQDRLAADGKVSFHAFHGCGKLKALMIFPNLFKGTHLNYEKFTAVIPGHEIIVKFDRPTALQIDGETIPDVTEYRVAAGE